VSSVRSEKGGNRALLVLGEEGGGSRGPACANRGGRRVREKGGLGEETGKKGLSTLPRTREAGKLKKRKPYY